MSKRSRLQRKAAHLAKTTAEREFDEQLAKIRADRDKALHDANRDYEKVVATAADERAKTRKEAWDRYEERRNTALRAAAQREAA